jgi:hypothetical protein
LAERDGLEPLGVGIVGDKLEQAASRGFEAAERGFKLIDVWRGSFLKTPDSSA